ncbi:MAG: PQQ-binding-like beta-propeller repeat protein [Candidatus Bathyarchaeota archaeon]|nr:PQQ-binding-like beta-propeller repeat protein [Candidatus Bathyarchaeota archaeon]
MQILSNKKKNAIIATLLIISFAASFVVFFVPVGAQQQPPTRRSYPIIDAVPNPAGVGEQVLIRTGILMPLGNVTEGWTGVTVTVVKPDNTTETLGPFRTDSTGSTFTIYTPDQAGIYKLTTHFPEQTVPSTFLDLESGNLVLEGTVVQAGTSETINLVVHSEPSVFYPGHALPVEYWSRPIDPQLREWYTISGNWVSRPDNSLALYNDNAPETPHVLWARDLTTGGLTGGLWGPGQVPASAGTGDAYEGKFINSVVMYGVLYYNRMPQGFAGTFQPQKGIYAVDLHSGKELWFRNNTELSFGQIFYFNSFNYDGVFQYLWDASAGTTWHAYDPFTSEWLYSMINVPSGTQYYGPSGEILILQADFANNWMALWNSTACGQQGQDPTGADYGSWGRIVHGRTLDASNPESYSWNVTIPAGLQVSASFFTPILKPYSDRVVGIFFNQTQVRVWGLNIEGVTRASTSASLLFDKTWSAPAEWFAGSNTLHYTGATNQPEDGVIAVWNKELRKHYAFSTETGSFLWETPSENFLNAYGFGNVEHTWYFAYDKLYSTGISGILYAYDLSTGNVAWTYNLTDPYSEPVTGNNWWGWITLIADGKIYMGTIEHSAEQPLPRGAPQVCINATDGSEIWRINGMFRDTRWGGNGVIGDSIIATMDTYDQRIYAIGKGPTKITVSASPGFLPLNSGVMITGSVMDISPGTLDYAIAARFPNGVPAVSDESQSAWMLTVYKQFDHAGNITGVPVILDVIDVNGNFRNIGTTTTDSTGQFKFVWTPDIEGDYIIIATFAGSKAYYGTHTQTYINVGPVAATPIPTAEPPASALEQWLIGGIIVIIIILIIIGAVLAFLIRRR